MNKWLILVAIRIRDPDTDPYRDTGKTCLVGGMHCPSASSYKCHPPVVCNDRPMPVDVSAAFTRRKAATPCCRRHQQSRRRSADRLPSCQCADPPAVRPSERRRRRAPWWASGRRTAGTWSRQPVREAVSVQSAVLWRRAPLTHQLAAGYRRVLVDVNREVNRVYVVGKLLLQNHKHRAFSAQ